MNLYKTKLQSEFHLSDGTVTTDLKLVTKKFNAFFVNVGPTLAHKFQSRTEIQNIWCNLGPCLVSTFNLSLMQELQAW